MGLRGLFYGERPLPLLWYSRIPWDTQLQAHITFNTPRLMSHVGIVREIVRANTSEFCCQNGGDASILRLTEQLQSCDCGTTGVKI